jgi:hypothetical protein
MATALLAEHPAGGSKVCKRTGHRFREGVESLASGRIQGHPTRGVTLQTKVIA